MILDGHIHIRDGAADRASFGRRLQEAGVDGGVLLSIPPPCFDVLGRSGSPAERLQDLFQWCASAPNLYPFFWIDPIAEDAIDQIALSVERGVTGFKVICDRYPPSDERAMATFRAIAAADRPILFHSGILWDGKPSGVYNRPVEFEALLNVDNLRFCLAHISWPWCDELIAVYGKFLNAYAQRPDLSVEMYIDLTPGTPPIYRREALYKLFTVGYDVAHNVVYGSDCTANDYNAKWAREWIDRDNGIYEELGLEQDTLAGIYGENLRRFLGLEVRASVAEDRILPRPGQ
jgi:predicted TIM-barrel fold metal-dependent hydrolase